LGWTSNSCASSDSVFSPLTAASATLALKAGVWFRRARLLIDSPDSRAHLARRQAETPLIALFRFPEPALSYTSVLLSGVGAFVGLWITATTPVTLRDRCQGSDFASLSGNTGHRAIFGAHRSVAIDPERTWAA